MTSPAPRLPLDPGYLRDLFSSNARTYDPVNLLISLGLIRVWRRQLVQQAYLKPAERVLDAFSGPGSLGVLASRDLGPAGEVVFADLSPVMLALARQNMRSQCRTRGGLTGCPAARFLQRDALSWPVQASFDVIFLGFALRYTSDPAVALQKLALLLRPGGRLAVLEFTRERKPGTPWTRLPRSYFHKALPIVAGRLGRGREVYDYLSASSASFLSPDELEQAAIGAGLGRVRMRESMGGLVCRLVGSKEGDRTRTPAA